MCARVHRTRVLHVASHMQQAHLRGLWLGHEGFRVPDGARKSKRDSPTYVGVCVWVWGWVMPISPAWPMAQVDMGVRKHDPSHAILSRPIRADHRSPGVR